MNIVFSNQGKNIFVQAQSTDMFAEIVNKFSIKSGVTQKDKPTFFFSGREIPFNSCQSLADLGIPDMGKIEVIITTGVVAAFW